MNNCLTLYMVSFFFFSNFQTNQCWIQKPGHSPQHKLHLHHDWRFVPTTVGKHFIIICYNLHNRPIRASLGRRGTSPDWTGCSSSITPFTVNGCFPCCLSGPGPDQLQEQSIMNAVRSPGWLEATPLWPPESAARHLGRPEQQTRATRNEFAETADTRTAGTARELACHLSCGIYGEI